MTINDNSFENPFWIQFSGEKISSYKFGNSDFIDFEEESDVYPSSSIPLKVRTMKDGDVFTFKAFHEGQGAIEGEATLERAANKVTEKVSGQETRYFLMEAGEIVEYGWGGTALSRLVKTKEEAIEGTCWR